MKKQTNINKNDDLLLKVKNLRVYFPVYEGILGAVDGVSFEMKRYKNLGIIGESGCGKSITALSVMGLVPQPPAQIMGEIFYYKDSGSGVALHKLSPKGPEYRAIRGRNIAMIFQEPMTCLNPVFSIGDQVMEAIMLHQTVDKRSARKRTIEMLDRVYLRNPESIVDAYPHQLSGGMRQRVMIAMALSCSPDLLIADEPTTTLDVTIQVQILDLIKELQKEFHTTVIIISHNIGLVANMADEVLVMYLGKVVEYGMVRDVLKKSFHPYTRGLLRSLPQIGLRAKQPIIPIPGLVSKPLNLPKRCRFAARCPERMNKCEAEPPLFYLGRKHYVRCWLYKKNGERSNVERVAK